LINKAQSRSDGLREEGLPSFRKVKCLLEANKRARNGASLRGKTGFVGEVGSRRTWIHGKVKIKVKWTFSAIRKSRFLKVL